MAPTEILARQHYATIVPICERIGVTVALLTGRDKGKPRAQTLAALADGRIAILIGTHALFQEDVIYSDLGLAVVDEQHRFGVDERAALTGKGKGVDTLVMSATPIPRSLTLAAYGDMDVSRLDEKPPGRTAIDTRLVAMERLDEVLAGLGRAIGNGARIYWVCPLIEESDESDLAAARDRHALLQARFGPRVGLIHGRMKGAERDAVMAGFQAGALDIMVATTVIEVGVDVPEASIMVIEHAERFGLAQLHQLRGRVGRGAAASTCLLLYASPLGGIARERLAILRETEDGFRIAEEDLRLRGAGDVLGTKAERHARLQAGRPGPPRRPARHRSRRRPPDHDPRPRSDEPARRGAAHIALPVPARSRGQVSALGLIIIERSLIARDCTDDHPNPTILHRGGGLFPIHVPPLGG